MKTTIFLISFLFSYLTVYAREEGFLWKISGNGLDAPSYLFGTYHGTFDILYNFTDSIPYFRDTFNEVERYVGESAGYDVPEGMDRQEFLASFPPNSIFLPQDTTYSDLLSYEEIQVLDSVLLKYMNTTSYKVPLAPVFLSFTLHQIKQGKELAERNLSQEEIEWIRGEVMDVRLLQEAAEKGYEVLGLEDPLEVMGRLFQVNDLQKSAKDLVKGLQMENPEVLQYLPVAYRSLHMKNIEEYGKRLDTYVLELMTQEEYQEMMDFLLTERNHSWMEKISALIQDKPTMIGVGVRHLPGENGLIHLLRQAGYTVESL